MLNVIFKNRTKKGTGDVAEEEECGGSVVMWSGAPSGVFGVSSKLCCVPLEWLRVS